MTRIIFITQQQMRQDRQDEADLQKREIRWALWCLFIVAVIFCLTFYEVMHIETVMKAKGY